MSKQTRKQFSLTDTIDYFETCNRAEGKSPGTCSWYSANLNHFLTYLRSRNKPDSLDSLNIQIIREYTIHLFRRIRFQDHPRTPIQTQPLSSATIHGYVMVLKIFSNWLNREGLTNRKIAQDIKPPKLTKKVIITLTDEEIKKVLNILDIKLYRDARDQAIFLLLLDTGLRIGEVVNLKMSDAHLEEGYLKVIGKGSKERVVPIGNYGRKALQRYIFRFRPKPANLQIENVFLTLYGRPVTNNALGLVFKRLKLQSGIKRLHAHLCRHTFATRFLINGGDIFSLQQILGHSSLEMVKHYVNLASSHVIVQHQRFSPLDHMKLSR
jgi:site-specific recombinase XerD